MSSSFIEMFTRLRFILFLLAAVQTAVSETGAEIQVAVGILQPGIENIDWLYPGKSSLIPHPEGLLVSLLPTVDCYVYAFLETGDSFSVLWPTKVTPYIKCLKAGESFILPSANSIFRIDPAPGTLTLLIFRTVPAELHRLLGKLPAEQRKVKAYIRELFQKNSRAISPPPALLPVAGTFRGVMNGAQGITSSVENFWGGMYEWHIDGK